MIVVEVTGMASAIDIHWISLEDRERVSVSLNLFTFLHCFEPQKTAAWLRQKAASRLSGT
jgi:hypothetical protein